MTQNPGNRKLLRTWIAIGLLLLLIPSAELLIDNSPHGVRLEIRDLEEEKTPDLPNAPDSNETELVENETETTEALHAAPTSPNEAKTENETNSENEVKSPNETNSEDEQTPLEPEPNAAEHSNPAAASTPRHSQPSAVVRVVVESGMSRSFGSGTWVHDARAGQFVLTCAHLFERLAPRRICIHSPDAPVLEARLVAIDRLWDLAILNSVPEGSFAQMALGRPLAIAANAPAPNEELHFAGYGANGLYREQRGQLLGYCQVRFGKSRETLVISGMARQGDSGGPILNANGELVGVLWGTDGQVVCGTYNGRILYFIQTAFPTRRGVYTNPSGYYRAWNQAPCGNSCYGGNCPTQGGTSAAANAVRSAEASTTEQAGTENETPSQEPKAPMTQTPQTPTVNTPLGGPETTNPAIAEPEPNSPRVPGFLRLPSLPVTSSAEAPNTDTPPELPKPRLQPLPSLPRLPRLTERPFPEAAPGFPLELPTLPQTTNPSQTEPPSQSATQQTPSTTGFPSLPQIVKPTLPELKPLTPRPGLPDPLGLSFWQKLQRWANLLIWLGWWILSVIFILTSIWIFRHGHRNAPQKSHSSQNAKPRNVETQIAETQIEETQNEETASTETPLLCSGSSTYFFA